MKIARDFAPLFAASAIVAGCAMPSTTSSIVSPGAIATAGDSGTAHLYVANSEGNTVTVYPLTGPDKHRTISKGILEPIALAFDGSGNLYVANCGGCFMPS